MDKNSNNSSRNSHEPDFSRSLKVVPRDIKISVPSAHTQIRSVFSSVIDKNSQNNSVRSAPISAKNLVNSAPENSAKNLPKNFANPTKIVRSVAENSSVSAPKFVHLDDMNSRKVSRNSAQNPLQNSVKIPAQKTENSVSNSAENARKIAAQKMELSRKIAQIQKAKIAQKSNENREKTAVKNSVRLDSQFTKMNYELAKPENPAEKNRENLTKNAPENRAKIAQNPNKISVEKIEKVEKNPEKIVGKIAKTAAENPEKISSEIAKKFENAAQNLNAPISFAEALANVSAPNFDPFAPNAVDPKVNKISAKKSKFAGKFAKKTDEKLNKNVAKSSENSAKNVAKIRGKIAAKKAEIAQKKYEKSAKKLENQKTRENLLDENNENNIGGFSENFANGLMAAAAETNDNFAKNVPEMPATDSGAIAKTQPKFVINVAGKNFAIGGQKFAKPNVKFAMPDVDGRKILSFLRVAAIVVILAVSGYLAWDTWMTNRDVQSSFTSASGAMSIATTEPSGADTTAVSAQQYSAYTTPADEPRYITIGAIGVSARVQKAGVTSSGNIDVPAKLADTAWYDGSAKPGQNGEVFIDGHTSFSSAPASFNDLPKLKAGDQITIQTGNGTNYNYKIVATETVATADVNMEKALNVQNGAAKGLTLMTCTGKYNYKTHDASERFVVYAVQE